MALPVMAEECLTMGQLAEQQQSTGTMSLHLWITPNNQLTWDFDMVCMLPKWSIIVNVGTGHVPRWIFGYDCSFSCTSGDNPYQWTI